VTVSVLKSSHGQTARKEGCIFLWLLEKKAVFLI